MQALTRLALVLFVAHIYVSSGLGKAQSEAWWNREAVWRAVHNWTLKSELGMPLPQSSFIYILAGIFTVAAEVFHPLVWFRSRLGFWACIAVIFLHTGIALWMSLDLFSSLMITLNVWILYSVHLFRDPPAEPG